MAKLEPKQVADTGADRHTFIEVDAIYNDLDGPLRLKSVAIENDLAISFPDDEHMEKFFRWLAEKFNTEVEIKLNKVTWEQQCESYSPR